MKAWCWKKLLVILIAVLLCQAAGAQDAQDHDKLVAIIEGAAPRALNRHGAPGAAVAMVINNRVAWTEGFGLIETGEDTRIAADSVFEIASVTKAITAWGVLKLAEEGRIDLDAPIEAYLTRWKLPPSEYDHRKVTARAILGHAAGLSTGGDPGVEPGEQVPTLMEAADGIGQEGGGIRVSYKPGEAYYYSSKGYMLLEMAIEDITSEKFASYMAREILQPLGMNDSRFDWTPDLLSRAATGHDWYNTPLPHYRHATRAQGGLLSTAGDVARFIAATMPGPTGEPPGRGVISPASVRQTFTPVAYSNDTTLIGLGYNLHKDNGILVARKTGDQRGFKALVFIVPDLGAGVAILSNSDRAAAGVFADIACPWSNGLATDPLNPVCGQLYMLRNVHLGVAALIAAGALLYGGMVLAGLRRGNRAVRWPTSAGRLTRIVVSVAAAGLWWAFWYTDIPLRQMGYPPTFFTVRFDPWPTALVWVSWSITALAAVLIATVFIPRAKT